MNALIYIVVAFCLIFPGCSRPAGEQKPVETSAAPAPLEEPPSAPAETATQPSAAKPKPASPPEQAAKAQPAPRAAAPAVIPRGTVLTVRTTSLISTKTHKPGETFAASLAEPLTVDGRVLAPRGADVRGRVVESDPGGRVQGRANLSLQLTSIELAGGRTLPIRTSTFGKQAEGSKKEDATKIGIGAGLGAAIGAIAGGGRGAAIGAGVGAAAGTGTVLATRGDAAEIPSESRLRFTLAEPARVE